VSGRGEKEIKIEMEEGNLNVTYRRKREELT
jgi:HSP20 family molecular chaperone IbpA